ncbi:MAG: iron-containing redox enzyme family protein, partial [Burkholderiales bacterium]
KPGERVFCFVPESGRFTVSYLMFTVVDSAEARTTSLPAVAPPHAATDVEPGALADLLGELAQVWHEYRSRAWRTQLIQRIMSGTLSRPDYLNWMSCWIPQVREGSRWMRTAVSNVHPPFELLAALIGAHADDEQFDFRILFDDYQLAGGVAPKIEALRRNPGGEALNAFMYASAAKRNPVGMLGAIYIIEGTGHRIVPQLLPRLRGQLDLPERCYRFLHYHGENDVNHLERWLNAVRLVLAENPSGAAAKSIAATARATADLYLLQLGQALDPVC